MAGPTQISDLHPRLAAHLQALGWGGLTDAQEAAYAPMRSGLHVLLVAPTGHGKTESALIPLFDTILHARDAYRDQGRHLPKGNKMLYVTPLRALNRDMLKRVEGWGEALGVTVGVRHGDTPQSERARQSRNPPDLLITTPETLQILFTGSRLREGLKTVRWLVVDEVHELAVGERGAQFAVAMERLERLVWEGRLEQDGQWPPPGTLTTTEGHVVPPEPGGTLSGFQRIGLSATVGSPHTVAAYLGGPDRDVEEVVVRSAKEYDIAVEQPQVTDADEAISRRILADPRAAALVRRTHELFDSHQSVLFFSNTRDGAEILGTRFHLWKPDYPLGVHHGSLSRDIRIEMEESYKAGVLKALICTSSLELGIDVGQTDLVVQLNSPRGIERLMQRLGRAGHRAGEISKGVVLCTSAEELLEAAVLAKAARAGDLPPLIARPHPLEVLANQLISMTQEHKVLDTRVVYRLLRQAAPFETLDERLFHEVLKTLDGQRSVWYEPTKHLYGAKGNSRRYFHDNISMIPDRVDYRVVDMATRKTIGRLDESFVLASLEVGSHFVLRGRPWHVIEIKNEEKVTGKTRTKLRSILVAPIKDVGNVPNWVGEDLPVRFETALEVGQLRRAYEEGDHAFIGETYALRPEDLHEVERVFRLQHERGLAVPTDRTVTLETTGKVVVINGCWGTQVNETLGRLLSALLAARLGHSIGLTSDAYRITLESHETLHAHDVEELLLDTEPESLADLLRLTLKNSNFVKWQLVHVARKFGALGKDLDPNRFSMRTLIERFAEQPLFHEALDKIIWERMDTDNTKEVLRRLQDGRIDLVHQKLSPVGRMGLEARRDLMAPQRADRTILDALRKRLDDTQVVLRCTNCGNQWTTRVERLPEQPRCAKCNAILVVGVHPYREDALKVVMKKDRSDEEEKEAKRLYKIANLVASWGRRALFVLSARGVGPDAASRILAKQHEDEYALLRDILEAELTYARTRGFWDK